MHKIPEWSRGTPRRSRPVLTEGIGAIITSYRRPESLRRSIDSLMSSSLVPDRLVVIDNSPLPCERARHLTNSFGRGSVYIHHPENIGLPAAISEGLLRCQDMWSVLILDDDTILAYDTLRDLVNSFTEETAAVSVPTRTTRFVVNWRGEPSAFPWSPTVLLLDAVREVGLPRSELFFCLDDWEYAARLLAHGYRISWIEADITQHGAGEKWVGRTYFGARNSIYIVTRRLSWRPWFVRLALRYLVRGLPVRREDPLGRCIRIGVWHGVIGKMGSPPQEFLNRRD